MPANTSSARRIALREIAVFLGLLFCGMVLLPLAIYLVGGEVFGDYGGAGFAGFFRAISSKIRDAEAVAWFLVLSPYLVWQILRLTALLWRRVGGAHSIGGTKST